MYDLRGGALRGPVYAVPFPSPSLLAFHPTMSSLLLAASGSTGVFGFVDVQSGSLSGGLSYQVDLSLTTDDAAAGGDYAGDGSTDSLVAADVSSSGEALAFGSAGGYVRLWGYGGGVDDDGVMHLPAVNAYSEYLEVPPLVKMIASATPHSSFDLP